jgi:type I restriction-modification system DNA methylase subunit
MKDLSKEFQTPADVCDYMVSLIPDSARSIVEPTMGEGNIVKAIDRINKSSKLGLRKFILATPINFFNFPTNLRFDCAVMNPPFSVKYTNMDGAPDRYLKKGAQIGWEMTKDCMKMCDSVITLLPWTIITNSDKRLNYMMEYGLVSVTALPRETFPGARIQCCVIHLQKNYTGTSIFKTLPK